MKIGIFQDIHANLPAFKKAIGFFKEHECSKIFHVGDLVGIGPYPKEVFQLALTIEELVFVMGNHDYWFAYGNILEMNEEEKQHQLWTHRQIGEEFREVVQQWNFVEDLHIGTKKIRFQHYGIDENTRWFKNFVPKDAEGMDDLFDRTDAEVIFYGHIHNSSDIQGNSRYVNLGSAGCYDRPEVRLGMLELREGELVLEKFSLAYDDDGFMEAFDIREVPARDFIRKTFITRKNQ